MNDLIQNNLPVADQKSTSLSMPMQLIELAIKNNGAVEQLEKLMELQDKWEKEQARKEYFNDLSSFQSAIPVIEKKKLVSFNQTNYKYAPLDDIMYQISPYLVKFGFSVRWEQCQQESIINVTCIVTHKAGHSERVVLSGTPDVSGKKNNIQSIASTVTYLRRYTLTGALGIATADPDFDGRLPDYIESKIQKSDEKQLSNFRFYPDDSFTKNWPKWIKAIEKGMISKENLIIKLESKGHMLTDEQRSQIQGIK